MLDTTRAPSPDIAAERVAADRAALSGALRRLTSRVRSTPAALIPAALRTWGRRTVTGMRTNPVPVALIAAGAGWLMLGNLHGKRPETVGQDPLLRWGDESPAAPPPDVDRRLTFRPTGPDLTALPVLAGLVAGGALALRLPSSEAERAVLQRVTLAATAALLRGLAETATAPRRA